MDILEFQGEHSWLSNFWPVGVVLDSVCYPSVENAYQAAKFRQADRMPFVTCTPGQAKRLSRFGLMRPDWDRVKVDVMQALIQQKFAKGSHLASKLIDTSPYRIVEGNRWGDTFWGVCNGRGQNILGELLMSQRTTLILFTGTQDGDQKATRA